MSKTLLLVDYENVGKIDLAGIPDDVTVLFFFGASQKTVPMEFLKAALKLGERLVPIDIEGHGKNALDFHDCASIWAKSWRCDPRRPA